MTGRGINELLTHCEGIALCSNNFHQLIMNLLRVVIGSQLQGKIISENPGQKTKYHGGKYKGGTGMGLWRKIQIATGTNADNFVLQLATNDHS